MQPVAEIQLAVGIAGAPGIIDQRLARLQRHGFAGPGIVVLLRDKVEIADFALGRIETAAFVRTGKITAAALQIAADGQRAPFRNILRRAALLRQNGIDLITKLADILRDKVLCALKAVFHHQLPGVAGHQGILRAKVQAGGGREHHQYHGGQDAHRGQSRAVALHAVSHGGD